MRTLIVVENPNHWKLSIPGTEVVAARTYLTDPAFFELKRAKIFNLCRSFRYQSFGYYVSLLAEARGHRPIPTLTTIQDLKNPSVSRVVVDDLEKLIDKSFANETDPKKSLIAIFGQCLDGVHDALASQLFRRFPAPFLQATFQRNERADCWDLSSIAPMSIGHIPGEQEPRVADLVGRFLSKPHIAKIAQREASFELAILYDENDEDGPSDAKALRRFEKAAEEVGFAVEFITRQDYASIPHFDALFIRETTRVNHHTYRFAQKAAAEGLVVIDDTRSILRCGNKVYLAELLKRHGVPTPGTLVLHRDNLDQVAGALGFPCVLKLPDSSFSQGVVLANDEAHLREECLRMFQQSDLLVAQTFSPSEFDWRVGLFDRKPLFVCKYYMARKHWQIVKRNAAGKLVDGASETLRWEDAPEPIVTMAQKASKLIGDGLYGVDLKEIDGKPVVIEINDNPSIDSGTEDLVLGPELYNTIMRGFVERIEKVRGIERKL
ncbi:MAG: RimK family protein [Myxococcales bacterium]|nr:RimK family protein [Myxococcales bacterium]